MSSNSFFPAISSIKTINNIKFTSRQVDVMACKMNNLTTSKEVANALFIEVGTVEKHTENIHKAASVNSAAALREFLRAQPELDELYQYFSHSLMPQQAFFQTIETLKNACEKRKIDSFESGLCFVCACSTEKKQRPASVDRLKKALEINRNKNQNSAEIDVIKLEECYEKETLLKYKKVVFFVDERNLKSSTFQKLLETLPSQEVILFFKGDAQLLSVISPPYNERVIETTTFDSFSYEVLKSFLSYLIEDPEIRDILNNKMHDVLKVAEGAPLFPKSSPYFAADQATKEGLENPSKRLRKAPAAIMSSALVVLLFVGGWAYSSFSKFAGDLIRSVQCELKLPQENVLIKRSSLLQKLTNMFMKHPAASGNVTVMGITGVAGSGKTTLARLWGRQWKRSHKNGVVWELAAESQTALTESIRLLGFSLAHSKEQKQEVHFIDDMKSVRDKDKMFVQFIRSQLQGREWMLIIDNATSPEKIQDLVFQEGGENGKGVVLLTSRNHLFKNCSFVPQQNILTLPSLSENNSLSLLCRILYDCTLDQLTEAQKLEARQFLKKLPPYPLDISVAASFMKENQLSFKEYLYELKAHRQALFTAQDNLMKIVSPSQRNRYSIVSLTTAKLLERFPHYDSLLMLCCLLGSENIPFDLLRTLYGTEDAHNFLIEMKKESLITSDYKLNGKRVISLHRFTQDLCLTYLATVKGLHLPKKPELLVKVINALESYVEKLVKNNNVQELRLMQGHIEKLLERDVLSPEMKASLEVIYGMLLYEMGVTLGDGKNIRILQRALQECDLLNEPKRSIRKGQANLYLGLLSQVTSKPQQAEEYYKESVKYLRKAKDSHWLSFTLAAYGQLRIISERDYNETEQLYLEAVRIGEASNAPSTFLARIYFTAGNLYGKWQKYKQGEPLFKKGFEVMAHQPNSYIYSWGWGFYGIFLQDKGDHYKAVEAFKKCVDLFQKRYGDKTRTMGWVKTRLGMGLMQIGHYKEAKKVLKEAVELNKMNGGKSNYGIALMYLGEAYLREGEFNAARKIIHESFELKKKIWGERVLVIWDPTPLAKLYIHDGHFEEAVTLLNQYLSSWRKKHGPNHESVIKLSLELAYMYMTHNKLENAKNLLFPLIDIVEKKYDQNHLFRGYLYWRLGEYHLLNEDYQKAGEVLNTAAVIFKQLGHPNLKEVLKLQTQSIKRMQP